MKMYNFTYNPLRLRKV